LWFYKLEKSVPDRGYRTAFLKGLFMSTVLICFHVKTALKRNAAIFQLFLQKFIEVPLSKCRHFLDLFSARYEQNIWQH
jgi:hypothetical protein